MAVNSIRFSGLASGLDTDSMVKAMLGNHQLKIDRQKQQQTLLDWKKDAWKEMNSQINTFYTKYVDKMKFAATFNKTTVAVSNPSAILLDKNVTIPEGNHTIEIEKMAARAMVSASSITSNEVDINQNTRLCDEIDGEGTVLSKGLGLTSGTSLGIKVNGGVAVEVKITADMTIDILETALKKAVGQIDADGKTVIDAEFTVKFDTGLKGFIISSKATGENQKVTIGGFSDGNVIVDEATATDASKAWLALGIGKINDDGKFKSDYKGDNAKILYNGAVTVESSTNNIEVNGIKFAITSETSEKITISSTKDTENTITFIKEFVEEYNKLIEDINTKLSAQKSRKYSPLSDEQKKSMSESDIIAWEKKIKDSLFSNDPQLKALRDSMRNILQDSDNDRDIYKSLSSIGITTGNWKEMGKLYIDEDKLRAAINDNGAAVVELFAGKTIDSVKVDGIGTKLGKSFQSMIKGITNVKSYSSYYNDIIDTKKLIDVNKQIDKLQDRYASLEQRYYAKFAAMEKALSKLNNQSSWLSQQTGGMQ